MSRESMEFDVVIIGAGPAGLAASIRLMQLNPNLTVCIIEKAEEVGAHSVSGAVLEPRALDELIPDWRTHYAPNFTEAKEDQFLFLTSKKSFRLPTPPQMHNQGNVIVSLSQFTRFLASHAENLGVSIFPGFAATEILYDGDRVVGIATGDKGIDKSGKPLANYQAGVELRAKQIIFAEGCRGSLTQTLFTKYHLRDNVDPQTYGLGIKEVWEVPKEKHQPGKIVHSIGWPLDRNTYGGSFMYHFGDNLVSIGFVVGLDYENPYLNPYEEFQRFKMHPAIYPTLVNGKRLAYAARTLVEGGLQSIPKLSFPGGVIIGDAAGFLNVAKIKGIHNAMKSGMIAAECLLNTLAHNEIECHDYRKQLDQSWLYDDLYRVRNIRPAFKYGLIPALIYSAIDTYLFRGKAPWTFHHTLADHDCLKKASECQKIDYPKHDNKVSFDLLSSVFLTHSHHEENQPCHLLLKNPETPIEINLKIFDAPEQRYCPAGVYEIVRHEDTKPRLQINAANCIQCKACDIKDPTQNIIWTPPEGGAGPQYQIT